MWGSIVDAAPDDRVGRLARPRLVVSVTASADGRVTLSRARRLLGEAAGKMWDSIHPGSADGMFARARRRSSGGTRPRWCWRAAEHSPRIRDGPITGLPAPRGDIATLYDDFLPAEANCRWFAVVNGRGRIGWTYKGDAGRRLLVIVSRATPAPVPRAVSPGRGCPLSRRRRWTGQLGRRPAHDEVSARSHVCRLGSRGRPERRVVALRAR